MADAAPPWDPSQLASFLVVWLDASEGITGTGGSVSRWADKSPNGNDAEQGTAAAMPALVNGVVNGHSVIRFDGTSGQHLSIPDSATLQWGDGEFAVVIVVAYSTPTSPCAAPATSCNDNGYSALWAKPAAASPYAGVALFGNEPVVPNGAIRAQLAQNVSLDSTGTAFNDGAFHVVSVLRQASGAQSYLRVRVDGVTSSKTLATGTNVDAVGRAVDIGGRSDPAPNRQMLKGDIAEILAIKGALQVADQSHLETYLKTKYGL
jgi:hypothetical protein